eukprot:CAMPEP_0173181470 /NCGR_PEP_ID=MMETSP1141-20130122/7298_1 /TAXON_ID=483371 /ORGANISM="non described non described, Strain CCMP2298" /LENGTH=273 /DNA_ID=CAMNT_0014104453 /DNA_START=172 /DNA_END=993 /DNA_ORIENTATION=+
MPGVDYYPFTVFQLLQPSRYNKAHQTAMGTAYKTFYKMEMGWGYNSKILADTADQDADKSRTYDYARMEYYYMDVLLYIDADEVLFCPQARAVESVAAQGRFQHRLMGLFASRGVEEMRFVRIPYSGRSTPDYRHSEETRSKVDFTNHTGECMNSALRSGSLLHMAGCWSSASTYDNFPKSADLASVCPFHYNHWSCDGMRGGGRDSGKVRCRCKVAFDMQNGMDYKPHPNRCHLMHLNDNKYRFQSNRQKYIYDRGNVSHPGVLYNFLLNAR